MTEHLRDHLGNRLGLLLDEERKHLTAFARLVRPFPRSRVCVPVSAPKEWSIPNWRQDDQGQRNFCHGHAGTACAEACYYVASNGQTKQFSRRFAGIQNMRRDGNSSRDVGATIESAAFTLVEVGCCPEEMCPYWRDGEPYRDDITAVHRDAAADFRIRTVVKCARYEDISAGMLSGFGFIVYGVDWTNTFASVRTEYFGDEVLRGQQSGGHAMASCSWKTRAGEIWFGNENSHHGWGFGETRRSFGSPTFWDRLCQQSRFGVYLVSDMKIEGEELIPVRPMSWASEVNW